MANELVDALTAMSLQDCDLQLVCGAPTTTTTKRGTRTCGNAHNKCQYLKHATWRCQQQLWHPPLVVCVHMPGKLASFCKRCRRQQQMQHVTTSPCNNTITTATRK